jgi:hypothetical protein
VSLESDFLPQVLFSGACITSAPIACGLKEGLEAIPIQTFSISLCCSGGPGWGQRRALLEMKVCWWRGEMGGAVYILGDKMGRLGCEGGIGLLGWDFWRCRRDGYLGEGRSDNHWGEEDTRGGQHQEAGEEEKNERKRKGERLLADPARKAGLDSNGGAARCSVLSDHRQWALIKRADQNQTIRCHAAALALTMSSSRALLTKFTQILSIASHHLD